MARDQTPDGGQPPGDPVGGDELRILELLNHDPAHPGLTADRLLRLLRSPRTEPALLQRIGRCAVCMKVDRVRLAIVVHPRTPRPLAMSLLSHLRWRDLGQVADAPGLGAPLRSSAEKILLLRLPELALGEKVTLARTATAKVLRALRREGEVLVTRALLDNRLLRVDDALFMVEPEDTPAAVLQAIAESPRFAGNQELCLAIVSHPRTPSATALRLVQSMDGGTLTRLLGSSRVPSLIAVAARRRCEQMGICEPPDVA